MSTSLPHQCPHCLACWKSPISAALCCDEAAYGPADDDHKVRPRYELGYD